MMVFIGAS
jgi:hypothetical protein